jgi:hypothetical protein
MKPSKASLLLHPVFISSLFVLLINDFCWKQEYHNWLTGKLSDFAGMIVLPVFLRTLFPERKWPVLLFTSFFFFWWKSPLSQPAIDLLHQQLFFPMERVVDYTDLVALCLLPVAAFINPVQYNLSPILQRSLSIFMAFFAVVVLCSTTGPYRHIQYYGPRENVISFYQEYKSPKNREEIIADLQQRGVRVTESQTRYYPHINGDRLYYRVNPNNDSIAEWVPVPQSKDSVIYLRRDGEPFYLIPFLVMGGDTLRNIEFSIDATNKKKKRSIIWVESFETEHPDKYKEFYSGKLHRQYRKDFAQLFVPKEIK